MAAEGVVFGLLFHMTRSRAGDMGVSFVQLENGLSPM